MIAPDQDVWPFIFDQIDEAVEELLDILEEYRTRLTFASGLVKRLEARYRMGEALYEREWLGWDESRFESERLEEIVDAILYGAMRRVRHPLSDNER